MYKQYKKYFRKTEELTSASIPQSSRPEQVKKVVKIGSLAKDGIEENDTDFFTEVDDEDSIVEDFLRNVKNKDEILDTDFVDSKKNKLVDKG